MPDPIISNFSNPAGVVQNANAQVQQNQVGNYRGQAVQQINQSSLLQDALEEMTESISEDVEKDFSKREVEEGKKTDSLEKILALKAVEEVLRKLRDMTHQELKQAVRFLLQRHDSNPRQLRDAVKEQFKDSSHQYAALFTYLQTLRKQGAPQATINAAQAALDQLLEEEGSAVRAGINITETADQFASEKLGAVQTLRDNYRDAVLDYQGLAETFGELAKKYGEEELPPAIRYLLKALSADISSAGTSIDKHRLNAVLNDMYRLEVLTSMLEQCSDLVSKTNECKGTATFRSTDLLKQVLSFQEDKWVRPEQISPVPAKLCIKAISREINFLREFKEFMRLIPLKAYNDLEQRTRILDAAQQALEDAIEKEQEEEL